MPFLQTRFCVKVLFKSSSSFNLRQGDLKKKKKCNGLYESLRCFPIAKTELKGGLIITVGYSVFSEWTC